MEFRKLFRVSAKSDISFISGFLRVTIEHGVNPARMAFDSAIFVWVVWGIIHSWPKDAFFSKAVFILVTAGAVADLAYQLIGSEILEFGPEGLKVRRNYLGWEYIRNYEIDKCSELSWQPEAGREGDFVLECRVGWRKIQFGKYLSEAQALEILSELQRYLPTVAQKMGAFPGPGKEHITRLGLS
jgi:hypothetical protein